MVELKTPKNLMKKTLLSLSVLSIMSCSLEMSNIKWVYNKGIYPKITIIPKEDWEEHVAKRTKLKNPRCYYHFQTYYHTIYVKEGSQDCLEHEFGHVRERVEKLPPHSKYAK